MDTATATPTEYHVHVTHKTGRTWTHAPVLTLAAAEDVVYDELNDPGVKHVRLTREINGRTVASRYSRV